MSKTIIIIIILLLLLLLLLLLYYYYYYDDDDDDDDDDKWKGGGRGLKALLHRAIFSATCLTMPLRDKVAGAIAQCNMGCLVRSRTQLDFSQLIAAAGHTRLHSVSPLQQLFSRNFTAVLTRAHAHISSLLGDKLLRKLRSANLCNLS